MHDTITTRRRSLRMRVDYRRLRTPGFGLRASQSGRSSMVSKIGVGSQSGADSLGRSPNPGARSPKPEGLFFLCLRIGAHMSVAGGVSKAVDRALVHGCEALQIFSKNASQWRGKPLDPAEVRAFRTRIDETGIRPVVVARQLPDQPRDDLPVLREQSRRGVRRRARPRGGARPARRRHPPGHVHRRDRGRRAAADRGRDPRGLQGDGRVARRW